MRAELHYPEKTPMEKLAPLEGIQLLLVIQQRAENLRPPG
nr:MAG TPA: hypothetical protein [Caudoviricetes sp.]DAM26143.1 MAG TPA: hypothetical protein [Caudoviricetes sp.]